VQIITTNENTFWFLWEELCGSISFQHPMFSKEGVRFYDEHNSHLSFEDKSFIIADNNVPLAGVIMTVDRSAKGNRISGHGRFVNYVENGNKELKGFKAAKKALKKHFEQICVDHDINNIIFREYASINGTLSTLSRHLLAHGATCRAILTNVVDLALTTEELHSKLSKSCRNSINWGANNLVIEHRIGKQVTIEDVLAMRSLHIKESGRETRSRKTWELQLEMANMGKAFMIQGYKNTKLVASSFFVHNTSTCLYFSSAAELSMYQNPLNHAIIWEAIKHAKNTSCRYFDFSTLTYNTGSSKPSKKEMNINTFKRGFGGDTKIQSYIEWNSALKGE
jgi:hypothetical protein